MLLTARHDFRIYMNRPQLLDKAGVWFLWLYAFMGKRGKVAQIIPTQAFFDLRTTSSVWRSEIINIGSSKCVTKGTR